MTNHVTKWITIEDGNVTYLVPAYTLADEVGGTCKDRWIDGLYESVIAIMKSEENDRIKDTARIIQKSVERHPLPWQR